MCSSDLPNAILSDRQFVLFSREVFKFDAKYGAEFNYEQGEDFSNMPASVMKRPLCPRRPRWEHSRKPSIGAIQ